MRDLLEQIQVGLQSNLYYLSLFVALAIPDICGAIDSEDGVASGKKYIEWFNKYVGSRRPYEGFLSGEDCWLFRCSLMHKGRTQHPKAKYSRIIFLDPTASTNIFHCNIINDALNIDVCIFCQDIVEGAKKWLDEVEGTERFKTNFNSFIRRYPCGFPPYIVGVPVIG